MSIYSLKDCPLIQILNHEILTRNTFHSKIAEALRGFDRKDCLEKAKSMETTSHSSLHLRSLDLNEKEILQLATILKDHKNDTNPPIKSISFSFNKEMKDEGIQYLLPALPSSLQELGLVNCGLNDLGGFALLNWAKDSKNLKMLCVENNNFSPELQNAFGAFRLENPSILVVT